MKKMRASVWESRKYSGFCCCATLVFAVLITTIFITSIATIRRTCWVHCVSPNNHINTSIGTRWIDGKNLMLVKWKAAYSCKASYVVGSTVRVLVPLRSPATLFLIFQLHVLPFHRLPSCLLSFLALHRCCGHYNTCCITDILAVC